MSFRELRDATEILRALNYPRLVSIENFRLPNFKLMAEILEWCVKRFDPNSRLPMKLDTEADRVLFVKSCVLTLIQKARVKLNPRNLYMSDGHAVRELLPVLRMLYQTIQKAPTLEDDKAQLSVLRSQVQAKRQEIRRCLEVASEIPHSGAALYDLLAKEIFAKEARVRALSQSVNASEVEKAVRAMIEKIRTETEEFQKKLSNITSDEQALDSRIDRRQREYDQLQKRLATLQSVRPAHMDEYERYESQLKALYADYVVKFRNLTYLQKVMAEIEVDEQRRNVEAEQNMRTQVEKMRIESEATPPILGLELADADASQRKEIRVYGNMTGAGLSDEDSDGEEDDERDFKIEDMDDEGGEEPEVEHHETIGEDDADPYEQEPAAFVQHEVEAAHDGRAEHSDDDF